MTTITIRRSSEAKCWLATFIGHNVMPDNEPLPLPFSEDAPYHIVSKSLRQRYPEARIYVA